MEQYYKVKRDYPDSMLLFRVGDFYETFGEDAVRSADILGITLTKRANGAASSVDLAGIPVHALDSYLPKLVRAGERVAICDQLEDPSQAKKIVQRGVTELVTPGIAYNEKLLERGSNNFLAAVHMEKEKGGVAFLDVSTGEFLLAEGSLFYIDKLLQGFDPNEVLYQRRTDERFFGQFGNRFYTYTLEDWVFEREFAEDLLLSHFGTSSLKGFGVEDMELGVIAAGAVMHYLRSTQHDRVNHISGIARIDPDDHVHLDRFTVRNLELIDSPNQDARTLLDVLDRTVSPMGARLLKRWVVLPLKDLRAIQERLDGVESFARDREAAEKLSSVIEGIGDLERSISRVSAGRIGPRELVQLRYALDTVPTIKEDCRHSDAKAIQRVGEQLDPCDAIRQRIAQELKEEPPAVVNKGNVMADGISEELDELRHVTSSGKEILLNIQQRESERTGIGSLKIAYNSVFGYYLEVKNTHKDKVPEDWIRKQTLVNAERYITEELKNEEAKILGAEERILEVETRLFNELIKGVAEYVVQIQANAALIAKLDGMLAFAEVSVQNGYVRPEVHDGEAIDIQQGRHPVIEEELPVGESYVANDVFLDDSQQQIMMITGPNMAGKSALLRQTALITIMAQIGCFVPASSARIGSVDKIFTRVGASDNISSGESTFMVEMNETASILNNLSSRSLVLLDEIGRGTSTYDGMSIARAIAEYIHEHPREKAKTLFATHYHELNELEEQFDRIKNYNIAVKEVDGKIIFLRDLERGGAQHSFGIHVARMAGMPESVVGRADRILQALEQADPKKEGVEENEEGAMQLSFFQLEDPVLERIREEVLNTDVNTLTPVEALMKLSEIKKLAGGGEG
ncbi:MAG: DNA mismatch repair protein MutS [Flavobacteriales bacterium]